MSVKGLSNSTVERRVRVLRVARAIAHHWFAIFIVLFGIYNALPFVAPVAMHFGWTSIGNAIYWVYSTQCHQMAQRSFFLFGAQPMYNIDQLPLDLNNGSLTDMSALRAFRGDESYGWKVAWSDRMVSMYGSLWLASLLYWQLSHRRPRKLLPAWVCILFFLPLAIDGGTHLISDFYGLEGGFRYENQWLAVLTNSVLPETFYRGDGLGSFNSLMRLVSGLLFGVAIAGLALPLLDREFRRIALTLERKLSNYDMGSIILLEG